MEEISLTGGNMQPVVRIGDTVRRVAGEWTPAVHVLLAALENAGIPEAPRAHGFDDSGREILDYIDGVVLDSSPVLWSPDILTAAGRLLRRTHDASVGLAGEPSLVWRSPRREPAEVVCHNDFATYNLIARGEDLVGVIDFDFAAPGPRLWDLAYLAYRIVPFVEDATEPGDLDRDARLTALIAAYGMPFTRADVLWTAADRLDALRAFMRDRARETGSDDLLAHAEMYERDAASLRAAAAGPTAAERGACGQARAQASVAPGEPFTSTS